MEYRLARDLGLLQSLDYDGEAEEVRQDAGSTAENAES